MVRAVRRHSGRLSRCPTFFSFLFCMVHNFYLTQIHVLWPQKEIHMPLLSRTFPSPSSFLPKIAHKFLYWLQVCRPFSTWRLPARDPPSLRIEIAYVFGGGAEETPRGEFGFHRSKSLHDSLCEGLHVLFMHFALLFGGRIRVSHRRKRRSLDRRTGKKHKHICLDIHK